MTSKNKIMKLKIIMKKFKILQIKYNIQPN